MGYQHIRTSRNDAKVHYSSIVVFDQGDSMQYSHVIRISHI